jgi:acyl-CoA reductase-like NAD-dependent aldehyde dehydrogenase
VESTLHLALVDGERVGAVSGAVLDVVSPATNQVIGQIPRCDERDVEAAVKAAKLAAPAWRAAEPQLRAAALLAFADKVAERGEELARLDSLDNGSPLHEMRNDIGLATSQVRYLAGLALEVRGRTMPETPGRLHYTMRQPFGVVARIIAFNHPLMFAATKIAAPLVAGNCVILKPSEFTSLSALAMAQDLARLFPPGVVQVLTGLGNEVGDALVRHPGIPRVAFIGSAATGRRIQASAATTAVKTVTLELGGKNPIVVFPDADLDLAVEGAVRGMNFTWQGQSCGSTSRLLIHRDCYDDVITKVGERLAKMRPGSPLDPASDTGAIVTPQQLDKVLSYIEIGKSEQARLVTGGERLTDGELAAGNFVSPALFADVDPAGRLAGHRGDLRPGAGRDPVRRLRRGGHHRQQRRVRADRERVHPRPAHRAGVLPRRGRGLRLGERDVQALHRGAVRRRQEQRRRPGGGPRGDRVLHPAQERQHPVLRHLTGPG